MVVRSSPSEDDEVCENDKASEDDEVYEDDKACEDDEACEDDGMHEDDIGTHIIGQAHPNHQDIGRDRGRSSHRSQALLGQAEPCGLAKAFAAH